MLAPIRCYNRAAASDPLAWPHGHRLWSVGFPKPNLLIGGAQASNHRTGSPLLMRATSECSRAVESCSTSLAARNGVPFLTRNLSRLVTGNPDRTRLSLESPGRKGLACLKKCQKRLFADERPSSKNGHPPTAVIHAKSPESWTGGK